MTKDKRDSVAVGNKSSRGEHGGNRAGKHDKDEGRKQSDPAAGKDPHRGNK